MCTNRVRDLAAARQEAAEPADTSAGAGRRLPADAINQPSVTGRSDKMADGSAGAKMATRARMTREKKGGKNDCGRKHVRFLMPVFPPSFGMAGAWRLGRVKSLIYGAVNPPVTRTEAERRGGNSAGAVTLSELYWRLKERNPSSMASVATLRC